MTQRELPLPTPPGAVLCRAGRSQGSCLPAYLSPKARHGPARLGLAASSEPRPRARPTRPLRSCGGCAHPRHPRHSPATTSSSESPSPKRSSARHRLAGSMLRAEPCRAELLRSCSAPPRGSGRGVARGGPARLGTARFGLTCSAARPRGGTGPARHGPSEPCRRCPQGRLQSWRWLISKQEARR